MQRQILIVDDIRSNREILKNILGDEYLIAEAAHGMEALAMMEREHRQLSLVLLDLGMPVLDGFEVLSRMSENASLSQIPVIVTTGQTSSDSEERALKLGAKDYISKPYKSAIIKQRIRNTINLRETAATVNALQRDRLTGLYNRETFIEKAAGLINSHESGYYVLSCFDIDSFKVINDQYGTAAGDEVLRHIARCAEKFISDAQGLCCRVMADNFAMLYPYDKINSADMNKQHEQFMHPPCISRQINVRIGRYIVNDLSLSVSAMYDRASLAEASIKGRYDRFIAQYDETMREFLLKEQRIVNEMDTALKSRQFEVWYQPQYNHTTGALIGAEALVRWRHPEQGLISPGVFIPIFEKNGFIYELDKFVWEEVCIKLRSWLEDGRKPLSVSVNISRYDVFQPDLVDVLKGLVTRYGISMELLRLEITESAFASSMQQIVDVVKVLVDYGFTLEIDDFGSGYSSLNTLKNVPAQVLKLDMRFLEEGSDSQRGGNIVESVVRMTKWLGMSIIAEGVETKTQADFLKSIGCSYVQGYLYAKPMTVADYEKLCDTAEKEERLLALETVENLDNNAFWNPDSMDTLIFNSYVGGACIFEYHDGKQELLRVNDKYITTFGGIPDDNTCNFDVADYMDGENRALLTANIERAIATGAECSCETVVRGIYGIMKPQYILSTVRVIAKAGTRSLIYATVSNTTAQREAELSERKSARQLKSVMDNVGCGITAVSYADGNIVYHLTNDKYYELLGYTKAQYQAEIENDAMSTIHPQDVGHVEQVIKHVIESGEGMVMEYRVVRRDKSVAWLRSNISMTRFDGVEGMVQLCTYVDITSQKFAAQELLDNLPDGSALYEYSDNKLTALYLNKRYWELVNRAPVSAGSFDVFDSVHPDDRMSVKYEIITAIRQKRDIECDLHLLYGDNAQYRLFHAVGRVVPKNNGKFAIYASYTPVSNQSVAVSEMLPIALRAVMASSNDLAFVKDKDLHYITCSRAFANMAGYADERDIVGKSDADLFTPEFAAQYMKDDRALMENGSSMVDMLETIPSADGRSRYSITSKYLLYDTDGGVVGLYGIGRDVTAAREMRSQLELLTNSIPGGIAIYEGRPECLDSIKITYFSDGFCDLFGYTRKEYEKLAEISPFGLVCDENKAEMFAQIKELLTLNKQMDCVYRAHVNGGGYKWINVRAVMGEQNGDNPTVNAVLFDITERQRAFELLRISEEENRLAIAHSKNVICRYNVAEKRLYVSPSVNPIFGVDKVIEDVPHSQIISGSISPETSEAYTEFYESIDRGEKSGHMTVQRYSSEGWRWIEANFSTIFSAEGSPVSAVVSFVDATVDIEKEAAYAKWRRSIQERDPSRYTLYRCSVSRNTVFDASEGSLLTVKFDNDTFDFDSRSAEYVTGFVYAADRENFINTFSSDILLSGYYQGRRTAALDFREITGGGGLRWLRLTVDLVEHPHLNEIEAYMLFEDIDELKTEELANTERVKLDPLTGVYNRTVFEELVNERLHASSPDSQHTLMMLDIDGFKQINDNFGHGEGDKTLIDIAAVLRSTLRRDDLICRLGGDEFMIFIENIPDESAAESKAKTICELTKRALSLDVQISSSIGVTITPRDGINFDTLYKKADTALYYVKDNGKNNYAFYRKDMADILSNSGHDLFETGRLPLRASKHRMLIVEDNNLDYQLLYGIFEHDFIIEKAKDGASALIRLRHYGAAISVVLLDLVMPGMDGFAVLKKMQQSTEMRTIPVVVVSGDDTRETGLHAIRAGASDFVGKPVDADELRIRVKSAISKADNERLRAKNSLLEYQSSETDRYRTVLERSKTAVVENNWINGDFIYDDTVSELLWGVYDERKLWHIMLTDLVADTPTVRRLQELVHDIAADRSRGDEIVTAMLKTPTGERRLFEVCVYKTTNSFGLTDKIYITFKEIPQK